MFYVYEIQYSDGTPFYVGKGKGDRYNKSLKMCKNKWKHNIINKIRKNGDEPLVKIIADNLIESVAFKFEISLIAYYGRRDLGTGILVNMTDGGEGVSGIVRSNETKQKMSDVHKGKKHSEETRRKMSENSKGRIFSKSHKNNLSISKMKENNPNYGKKSHIRRRVIQIDKDANKEIKIWSFIKQAADELNINASNISQCCKGKRKTTGRFIWRYA